MLAQPILETRPISDLRTDLPGIENAAKKTGEPIVLTRNGSPALVVMDCAAYNERIAQEQQIAKLREAEIEAKYRTETVTLGDSRARLEALASLVGGLHA